MLRYNPKKDGETTALAVVLSRVNRIAANTRTRVLELAKGFYPGNGTWGAIDYLSRKHGYVWFRKT